MEQTKRRYTLFGVSVRTELPLPLPQCNAHSPADVEVVPGRVVPGPDLLWHENGDVPFTCTRLGHAIVLEWPGMRFGITEDRIVIDTRAAEAAVIPLMQATWAVMLTARGREALHAGVVARDGRAMAIVGPSGSGKSTAVLALLDRGWQLVADDLLTFDDDGCVLPGPPFIRLTRDRADGRSGTWDRTGKLRYQPALCAGAVPLGAMVVHNDAFNRLHRLSGVAAVGSLVANMYNDLLTHPGQAARRLDLAVGLAGRVPIYGAPPRSLTGDQLDMIARAHLPL